MPPYRHSVFATSDGSPVNGAASATTLSRNGTLFFRSATFFASSPARDQISMSCEKPILGTVWENGFFTLLTSKYWPLGDGVTLLKMPGRPIVVFAPVPVLTATS